jgi:hypothetical protein
MGVLKRLAWITLFALFSFRAFAIGFGQTSPTTGTADFIAEVNYGAGVGATDAVNIGNVSADDGQYTGFTRTNGGGANVDLNGYLVLNYSLSNITGLSGNTTFTNLSFNLRYCYANDLSAPITCSGTAGGVNESPMRVWLYNFTASAYQQVQGILPVNGNTENDGRINVTIDGANNITNFVSSAGLVSIRYAANTTITVNGNDASFAADQANLTVFFNNTPAAPAADSCTYSTGNWVIQLSDNCVITTPTTVYPNYVRVNGTQGMVIFNATIITEKLFFNVPTVDGGAKMICASNCQFQVRP